MALSFVRNKLIYFLNRKCKPTIEKKMLIKCGLKELLNICTIRKEIIILRNITMLFKMILIRTKYIEKTKVKCF